MLSFIRRWFVKWNYYGSRYLLKYDKISLPILWDFGLVLEIYLSSTDEFQGVDLQLLGYSKLN